MKTLIPFLLILVTLTSCRTPESAILERKPHATIHVNKPYVELGECIWLHLQSLNGRSSYRVHGIDMVSETRIEKSLREAEKAYYINDATYAGFNEFRIRAVIVKQDTQHPGQSVVQLKSKPSLWGKTRFTEEFFRKYAQECL